MRVFFLSMIVGFCGACSTMQNVNSVDQKRLQYAQGAIEKTVRDWQLNADAIQSTCVIVFDKSHKWLLNCPQSLPVDSVNVSANIVAQAMVFTPWQQQQKKMNQPPIVLMHKLEDLVVSHPGFPKESTTTEEILSIYIHEFFHVMQFTYPQISQFMDQHLEKKSFVDQSRLVKFYSTNPDYQAAVKKEYDLLSSYLKSDQLQTPQSAKKILRQWLKLYNERTQKFSKSFGGNLKTWDAFWMFIEGSARYVESQFLLDPSLRADPEILSKDIYFKNFSHITGDKYTSLPAANRSLGNKYYYAIGAHVGFVLDIVNQKDWKKRSFQSTDWLVGAVKN